jgi:hypothetical protein
MEEELQEDLYKEDKIDEIKLSGRIEEEKEKKKKKKRRRK